jgi:hypothetical protein
VSKSVERRLAGHLPWLVLGFNPGKRTVVIAGFAGTEQEATAKAVSRAFVGTESQTATTRKTCTFAFDEAHPLTTKATNDEENYQPVSAELRWR